MKYGLKFLAILLFVLFVSNVNAEEIKHGVIVGKTNIIGEFYFGARGIGISASSNASLEIKKQEAFVAAFFDAVRNTVEKRDSERKSEKKLENKNPHSSIKIGDFDIYSETIIENFLLKDDLIIVDYKGQKIVIKKGKLISPPVNLIEFPKWNDPKKAISDFVIEESIHPIILQLLEDEKVLCVVEVSIPVKKLK